jgi:hypothetical protein
MSTLEIDGQQRRRLSDAIGSAFTVARLRQMLDQRLDKRLDDIALGDDYQEIRFKLIQSAQAEGWTLDLLVNARQENPGNPALFAFAQELGLTATSPAQEREIRKASPFFDPVMFRTRLGEVEGQICRIEFPVPAGTVYGTGFLVGPDAVMTNNHVLEPVISGQAEASNVTFLFDYKVLDGLLAAGGTKHVLADEDWLVDTSPLSQIDLQPDPKATDPPVDELDYAVVRLARPAGREPIGNGTEQSPPRGWIAVRAPQRQVATGDPMFVIQHPAHQALKLAMEMNGVIGAYAGGTRIRHTVNTEGGSSGAPCFNSAWELIGVHHVGDPNFTRVAAFNEAVAIDPILALLQQRGKLGELDLEV